MLRRKLIGKKLLIASLGVAAINYAACSSSGTTSGNLLPPPEDAARDSVGDATPIDVNPDVPVTSGNLMPPPPVDSSSDGEMDAPSGER